MTTGNDSRLRTVLQRMAWQRAKGELYSILETFYDEEKEYNELEEIIFDFIKKVEEDSCIA